MSQAQRTYDWERNFVEPKLPAFLSKEECLSLVRRAAAEAGMEVPAVRFAKAASMPCRAVPSKWEIVIADWGRTPVTVLHEMAHLAAIDGLMRGEDGHGPSFMGWACAYYSRLLGLDHAYLVGTANSMGLHVSDPARAASRGARGFHDVEF